MAPVRGVVRRPRRARSAVTEPGGGVGVCVEGPRSRVVEIQRSRLLVAAVGVVAGWGYEHATVARITSRARVSRRTFYQLFANRDDCLMAVLDSAVEDIRRELAGVGLEGLSWRERVRMGLWTILSFLDRDRVLARCVVVQFARGGEGVLERRVGVLRGLAGVVDEGRLERSGVGVSCSSLIAEGLVGGVFSIVYARLLEGEGESLTGLLGELMGVIVLPYLGAGAARREQSRPAPALLLASRGTGSELVGGVSRPVGDPLEGVPMRLTYRTSTVLGVIACSPGASNRGVAQGAGISDQGQVSKLLARLERLGLIKNRGEGHARGEANAWWLTSKGERVVQNIRLHTRPEGKVA